MHHIFHTEGFVLGSKNYREADKYYYILTRDFGLIYASAQGIRKISSKLRFVLQDFAYIRVDLVRGRDFWRITTASKTNLLEFVINPIALGITANISKLLRRLLAGEEANEKLFMDLVSGFSVLEKAKDKKEAHNIETIIVLRILNNLGYIGEGKISDEFILSPFEGDLIFQASENRNKILREINKALKETHL